MYQKVAVFVSGRGTNLRALWDTSIEKSSMYQIHLVVADRPCNGINFAKEKNIPYHILDPKDRIINSCWSGNKKNLTYEYLLKDINIIALAGFMRIIQPSFLKDWLRTNKLIINIHPSLLPKYRGLNSHSRAIAAKESESGCTVHYVDDNIDTGKIIAQACCPILPNDTTISLAARIIKLEHVLYPKCLTAIACGNTLKQKMFTSHQLSLNKLI